MTQQTWTVRFDSRNLESGLNDVEYIGPFYTYDDACDFADHQNNGLAYNGHPALYSVV
jgi:hypothetical protein